MPPPPPSSPPLPSPSPPSPPAQPLPPSPPPPLISVGGSWSNARLMSVALGMCWTANTSPLSGTVMVLMQPCNTSNQLISLQTVTSSWGYGTGLVLTTQFGGSQWQIGIYVSEVFLCDTSLDAHSAARYHFNRLRQQYPSQLLASGISDVLPQDLMAITASDLISAGLHRSKFLLVTCGWPCNGWSPRRCPTGPP